MSRGRSWVRCRDGLLLCALVCTSGGVSLARAGDALDRVTGTEGWAAVPGLDIEGEWRAWLSARSAWRGACKELRVQRSRNRRLAALLRRIRATARDSAANVAGPGAQKAALKRSPKRQKMSLDGQAIDDEADRILEQTKPK